MSEMLWQTMERTELMETIADSIEHLMQNEYNRGHADGYIQAKGEEWNESGDLRDNDHRNAGGDRGHDQQDPDDSTEGRGAECGDGREGSEGDGKTESEVRLGESAIAEERRVDTQADRGGTGVHGSSGRDSLQASHILNRTTELVRVIRCGECLYFRKSDGEGWNRCVNLRGCINPVELGYCSFGRWIDGRGE